MPRLASVGIQEKKKKPGVGKLGWYGNFDMRFDTFVSFFFNFSEKATAY